MARPMSRPRAFLALLGIVFLAVALGVALWVDRLIGLGVFIVGAFLLILPFLGIHEEE